MEPDILEDYDSLVLQLERRFKVKHTRETSQRLFYSRFMKPTENFRHFAADLKSLIHKAYPLGLTNEVREDMLLKQFFDGLTDAEDARYYVKYLQRPRSLDEAVDLMQEYQAYRGKAKTGRRQPVRMVIPADDPDSEMEDPETESSEIRSVFPERRVGNKEIETLCTSVKELTKAVTKLLLQSSSQSQSDPPSNKSQATSPNKQWDKSTAKCYNCQGLGHFGRDCPSPRKKFKDENSDSKKSVEVKSITADEDEEIEENQVQEN